ncbi:methionine synthase [Filimonas sp.]|nr:methionine synthase [Filimonas sp.]
MGTQVFHSYSLAEIAPYIDWTPFFITWEMHGKYPGILSDEKVGAEATKLFIDANALLNNSSTKIGYRQKVYMVSGKLQKQRLMI